MYNDAIKSTSYIEKMGGFKDLEYEYSIIGKLLCLRISNYWCQIGGAPSFEDTIYYFNLENGKRLTIQEALKELNLTEEKLTQKINLHLKKQYKEDESSISETMTENEYIQSFKYDIKEAFLNSDKIFEITVDSDLIMDKIHMTINI
jgi:hypothetical protein